MITVLHFEGNKDPDIYFGLDNKTETKIIKGLQKDGWDIKRASDEEWYGQSDSHYAVHHWNAKKKRGG